MNASKLPLIHSSSGSATPTNDNLASAWTKKASVPPVETTEDERQLSRPQSPNVEQIAERNQLLSTKKKQIISEDIRS